MNKIVIFPDATLRVKTVEIKKITPKLSTEIDQVVEILKSKEDTAAGLAATQLGFESRFFAQKEGKKDEIRVYINPKVVKFYGEKTYPVMVFEDGKKENFLEGCLSFPDIFGIVKRFLKVEVEWDEIIEGKLVSQNKILKGFDAIVFQHEAEHLDGILFVDHIKRDGGDIFRYVGNKKVTIKIEDIL